VLSILPPFRIPPVVLFGTRGYWVAVGDSAKTLCKALGCPVNRSKLQFGYLDWIAVERVKIDPTRFKDTPLYRRISTSVLFVG
jgi:hypothetical protein